MSMCYIVLSGFLFPSHLLHSVQVHVVGRSKTVCQKAFALLYGITIARVGHIAKASSTDICAPKDKRGKYTMLASLNEVFPLIQH